jgi:hypothetical protein
MVERHGLDATAAAPVIKGANYLVQNGRWLHYDRALAGGLPIATGVIEGACRYLVQDRMGRTGARWSIATTRADCSSSWSWSTARTSTASRTPVRCRCRRSAIIYVIGEVGLSHYLGHPDPG